MKPRALPRSLVAATLALAATLVAPAFAKDLGVRGATWPVAESDLLAEIETSLSEMERSGELARLEAEARTRARSLLEAPEAVPGIAPARALRSWTFDPAVTVAHDFRTPDGRLVAAAGTRIDPFDHVPLTRDLLFIDGTREVEVDLALAHTRPAKIVLLAGRPLVLARRHGRPFFFDQGGRLASRFGLHATPSLVERTGSKLRISEIPVEDRGPGSSPGQAHGSPSGGGDRPVSGADPQPERED